MQKFQVMKPNARVSSLVKHFSQAKKDGRTNKFITLRHYEHQIYNLDWVLQHQRNNKHKRPWNFPTSITTPQEKKKFYPITSNCQEGNNSNNNNNNRVPKWLLYTCVYFVY